MYKFKDKFKSENRGNEQEILAFLKPFYLPLKLDSRSLNSIRFFTLINNNLNISRSKQNDVMGPALAIPQFRTQWVQSTEFQLLLSVGCRWYQNVLMWSFSSAQNWWGQALSTMSSSGPLFTLQPGNTQKNPIMELKHLP